MKHGHTKGRVETVEYTAWKSMNARCSIPSASHYAEYGGRGIKVCAEWRHDFTAFYAHVGPKPTPQHSLDRIDADGDYEPGNVRWATRDEQHRNQRSNRMLTIDGETMCVSDWARRSPVSFVAITRRLDAGWEPHPAVFAPSQNHGARELRRRPADYLPWQCLLCGETINGCKAPNLRVCLTCRPTKRDRRAMIREGLFPVDMAKLQVARAEARAERRRRKSR